MLGGNMRQGGGWGGAVLNREGSVEKVTIELRLERGEGTCAQISGELPGMFEGAHGVE